LAVFETAAGAVGAALEIQRQLASIAAALAPPRRMPFRIGVHLGDVIEKSDGSVYGDGVNIAARLQAVAPTGGIAVSDAVRGAVRHRAGAVFEDLGEQTVKNIAEPVRAFHVHAGAGTAATATARDRRHAFRRHGRTAVALVAGVVVLVGAALWWRTAATPAPTPITMSVAIGPITSADASLAGDAKTIAHALATGVTAWASHVRVVTVDRDSGGVASVREAAGRAGARYLLDGDLGPGPAPSSVALRLGDIVRGVQVWSRSYALPAGGEARAIALRRVVGDLAFAVGDAEVRRVLPLPVERLDPMELVVRSYGVIAGGMTAANAAEARRLLLEARRREPTLVPALLMMSDALSTQLEASAAPDHDRLVREFDEVSDRAVTLEPGSPIAWATRSTALLLQGRWTAALEAGERYLRLDPHSAQSHLNMASLLIAVDRPAEALSMTARAIALNPDATSGAWQLSCRARVLLGDAAAAVADCERSGTRFARDLVTDALLASAYAQAGQTEAALRVLRGLSQATPGLTVERLRTQRFSDHPGYLKRVESTWYAGLRKAGVPDR
jgi:hypothetical protein